MRTLRVRMPAMTVSTAHGCVRRVELAPSAEATGQFQMLRAHLDANGSRAGHGPRRFGHNDVPCEAESCQQADHPEHRVELPRAAALHRGLRIGVMIVVPSFAVREIPDEEIVSAVVVGFVAAIAPQMRSRIHEARATPCQYLSSQT